LGSAATSRRARVPAIAPPQKADSGAAQVFLDWTCVALVPAALRRAQAPQESLYREPASRGLDVIGQAGVTSASHFFKNRYSTGGNVDTPVPAAGVTAVLKNRWKSHGYGGLERSPRAAPECWHKECLYIVMPQVGVGRREGRSAGKPPERELSM